MKLYRCAHCGNIIEKVIDKGVPVICCGEEMQEVVANTTEAALEKHIPVLSIENGVLTAKVGEVEHPMTEEHYITTIIAVMGNKTLRADLTPSDHPVAEFLLGDYKGEIEVYEYCNLHGLCKANINA
ncbi:MAG: desulfoferrodoxin family protein [Coprobacillus sp.]